jgi:hypothetical protein
MNDQMYKKPEILDKEEFEKILASNDAARISEAIIAASFYIEDFDYVFNRLVELCEHIHEWIRGNAMLGLGHLARIHGKMPIDPTVRIISQGLCDPSEYVRGQADGAYDSFQVFAPEVASKISHG